MDMTLHFSWVLFFYGATLPLQWAQGAQYIAELDLCCSLQPVCGMVAFQHAVKHCFIVAVLM